MGMFDYVIYEANCPKCSQPLIDFQSKDGPCELLILKPKDVDRFYTDCKNCGTWVEFETEVRVRRKLLGITRVKPEIKDEDNQSPMSSVSTPSEDAGTGEAKTK